MKKQQFKLLKNKWQGMLPAFFTDTTAAIGLAFAFALPMFIAASGIAVDLAQAYNVKTRLANALDKAALAAGSTSGTADQITDRVQKFIKANYPDDKLGTAYDIKVVLGDGLVTVSAHANVKTTFMEIFGTDSIDVYDEVAVRRDLAGVEAVLVLDVTGSMAGNNITALKTACTNFLNTMFTRISDINYLKIGIVPFSQSVNVGKYGLGQKPDGTVYGTAFVSKPSTDTFVNPASNIVYGTSGTNWRGCITEIDSVSTTRVSPKDTSDDSVPNWGMYRYPRNCTKTKNGVCQSWDNSDPNRYCTNSVVVPMNNSQTTLQSAIDALSPNGGTYTNLGMVWGWRLISPTTPFTEGVQYGDPDWTKTVIIMTDGNNEPNNAYSAYGKTPGLTAANLDSKLTTVCNNMKAKGIRIYTITFQSDISNATRDIYRQCATDSTKYFNAPSNQDLIDAFNVIANQLSQLHLVK